uniref:Ig-like domain-containing protein n=1 Tax=Sinocyclocheilus grahami TaxID=75366 RepID=A0A672NP18_SINGR
MVRATRKDFVLFLSGLKPRLLLLSPVSLQDPVHITGVVGGSVILPCSYKERVLKPVEMNVFWRYNEIMVVYDIENGSHTETQDSLYKNRTERFPEEYMRGNFSIELNNLTHADAGKYTCHITHSSELQTVQLIIKGRLDIMAFDLCVYIILPAVFIIVACFIRFR